MKTRIISLSIVLLMGVSAWADDVWSVFDYCNLNGYVGSYCLAPAPTDVYAIDLGLPSGVKWASCNVGAEKPSDYGYYYAWGEILPKRDYLWKTYEYYNRENKVTKYCTTASYGDNGFVDNKIVLELEDDAASANWGSNWRMPTHKEWMELIDSCNWIWASQNGIRGYQVISKINGNSIFLPIAGMAYDYTDSIGCYWCSSLDEDSPYYAKYIHFTSINMPTTEDHWSRSDGLSVRPVCSVPSSTSGEALLTSKDCFVLTLYADGCDRANVIKCNAGQQVNITATKDIHRHFVRWTDGNTDNPRLVTVTKDTTFTAEFAFNQYAISAEVNDANRGRVEGSAVVTYPSDITLIAIANYGFHFAHWGDYQYLPPDWNLVWNTDNPRTVHVTSDATYTAVFEKNTYTITAQSANGIYGSVFAPSQA